VRKAPVQARSEPGTGPEEQEARPPLRAEAELDRRAAEARGASTAGLPEQVGPQGGRLAEEVKPEVRPSARVLLI
jgi:hypothetical protein